MRFEGYEGIGIMRVMGVLEGIKVMRVLEVFEGKYLNSSCFYY